MSIATLTGDNGILQNAARAKEQNLKATLQEEINLSIMEIKMEETINNTKVTLETLANGQLATKLDGITTTLENNKITGEYKRLLL